MKAIRKATYTLLLGKDSCELFKYFDVEELYGFSLKECTEYLFDENQVYKIEEMQPGEFEEFISNLTTEQYRKIKKFFLDMPILRHQKELVCGKCNKKHTIKLEGLLDFFA